jgi:hypothetical protein
MDLDRMLEKCRAGQWRLCDLDLSAPPRPLGEDDESAIVQYFTDMAGIERLAGALFAEQRRRAKDPRLVAVFESFVEDEERHARAAELLARHYDRRKLREYRMNPALVRFAPHFVTTLRFLSDEIANAYITAGEIILDVALLRSINDYVADAASQCAMDLVNRDESRHLAVDFHMVEHYGSAAYEAELAGAPAQPLSTRVRAALSLSLMLWYAAPFFRAVFFDTMDRVDPSGARIREAFKRIQLLSRKKTRRKSAFIRFMMRMHDLYMNPVSGRLLGRGLGRLLGCDPRVLRRLFTDEDIERVQHISFDAFAEETLALKYVG